MIPPSLPPSARRSHALRERLVKGTISAPGAFNALSARLIERKGFSAVYLSGAVLSNSIGGVPDTGLMTLDDFEAHIKRIAAATTLPIISDADTGFGDADAAAECVRRLEAAGASAIHIEDQEFPKRCGHLDGKTLITTTEMAAKLKKAHDAKASADFLLIARTDARAVEGFDPAVDRARAYLAAGADAIFPEALQSLDEFVAFRKAIGPKPILLANMTEFGKSPALTHAELEQAGYSIVIFPVTLQRVAMRAAEEALDTIRRTGSSRDLLKRMQTRSELYELLDYCVD